MYKSQSFPKPPTEAIAQWYYLKIMAQKISKKWACTFDFHEHLLVQASHFVVHLWL